MDARQLRENRQHGTPAFPVGFYRMEREPGEVILDNHWHDELEFLQVTAGKAVFQIGLVTYEVKAGEALFVPGGELHGAYPLDGAGCSYQAVVFDLSWLIGAGDSISSQYLVPLLHGRLSLPIHWKNETHWEESAIRTLEELHQLEGSQDPARELRVKIGLLSLFADLITAGQFQFLASGGASDQHGASRLKDVLAYMEENRARKLTVSELARRAGMSEGHFSRLFRSYLRTTPIVYLNRLRLRYAAERLAHSDTNVSEAASEAGFDNFSYFIKQFRSEYGCTPGAYRKQSSKSL